MELLVLLQSIGVSNFILQFGEEAHLLRSLPLIERVLVSHGLDVVVVIDRVPVNEEVNDRAT